MNLLLLLSAMLSALTGVAGGVRQVQPAAAVAQAAQAKVTLPSAAVQTSRPSAGIPTLSAVRLRAGMQFAMTAAEPLFANRRRE